MPGSVGESSLVSGRAHNAPRSQAYSHESLEACREAALRCVTPRPLVLVGAPGSGKSKLLHGVAQYVRACRPAARIVEISPEHVAGGESETSRRH